MKLLYNLNVEALDRNFDQFFLLFNFTPTNCHNAY